MFRAKRLIAGAAVLATAVGCASIRGTDSISDTSRTGAIHTVNFEERMTPTNLRVQPGDEVRWVNQRSTAVTVELLGDALADVTCQTGFSDRKSTRLNSSHVKSSYAVSRS